MATTPPPPSPSALRVPAAPLHGAGYDTFEPYSTRSSARIASQRASRPKETHPPRKFPGLRGDGQSMESPRKYRRVEERALSPANLSKPSTNQNRGRFTPFVHGSLADSLDADSLTTINETESAQHSSSSSSRVSEFHPLPTPSKTPSKKKVSSNPSSTARTLFPSSKMSRNPQTPFSLNELDDEVPGPPGRIEIFTDSRDRIPVAPRTPRCIIRDPAVSTNGSPEPEITRRVTRSQVRVGMNNETTYMFRGQQRTRRYPDFDPEEDEDNDPTDLGLFAGREHLLPDPSILQNIKPLRRKDIKPRMLWHANGDPVNPRSATPESETVANQPKAETKPANPFVVEDDATDDECINDATNHVDDDHRIAPSLQLSPVDEQPEQPGTTDAPGATRNLRSQAHFHPEMYQTPIVTTSPTQRPSSPFKLWGRKKKKGDEILFSHQSNNEWTTTSSGTSSSTSSSISTKRDAEDDDAFWEAPSKRTRSSDKSLPSRS
ncbi:uncharacterized protein N7483_001408 [Penicillium malachiteum]|uniref:uncharacterized protein n=1 Tax=Penicillium malachiteum TaxID=1324776 RepID=UPI0025484FC0|nr:uncharacterized protein N7483_001408 [Penicillium malachiteum]KAJ5736283.1 hypothetical protein N7483_001408 [Penicillium malachiteum]